MERKEREKKQAENGLKRKWVTKGVGRERKRNGKSSAQISDVGYVHTVNDYETTTTEHDNYLTAKQYFNNNNSLIIYKYETTQ